MSQPISSHHSRKYGPIAQLRKQNSDKKQIETLKTQITALSHFSGQDIASKKQAVSQFVELCDQLAKLQKKPSIEV